MDTTDKKETRRILDEARKQIEVGIGRAISARGELALRTAIDNAFKVGQWSAEARTYLDREGLVRAVFDELDDYLSEYSGEVIGKAISDTPSYQVLRKKWLNAPPLSPPSRVSTGLTNEIICGSKNSYVEDTECVLKKGHKGKHKGNSPDKTKYGDGHSGIWIWGD